MSIGWPEETGDLGKLKLNICWPEDEVGWAWPSGGFGETEEGGLRGDWRGFSVADGESSWREREQETSTQQKSCMCMCVCVEKATHRLLFDVETREVNGWAGSQQISQFLFPEGSHCSTGRAAAEWGD